MIATKESPNVHELEFEPGYLFACLPFLAEGAKHPAFSCVNIGDGWMGATDASTMLLIEDDVFKGCNYQLSGPGLSLVYDKILERQDEDFSFRIHAFKLRIVSDSHAVLMINGTESFEIELMAYPRINIRDKDIEKPTDVSLTAEQMPYLDPYLMGRFIDGMSLFYGADVNFVRPLPTGLYSPIYIDLGHENIHGLMMPGKMEPTPGHFPEVGTVQ